MTFLRSVSRLPLMLVGVQRAFLAFACGVGMWLVAPPAPTEATAVGTCQPSIQPLSGSGSAADINNTGLVVGTTNAGSAVVWENGQRRLIARHAKAAAVNDRGLVVGTKSLPDGRTRAFTWRDGNLSYLPSRGFYADAFAVNDMGWVVGRIGRLGKPEQPALWIRGRLKILSLPAKAKVFGGYAVGVNNIGQVIGNVRGGGIAGFRWWDGRFENLGTFSYATSIDAAGRIGGVFNFQDGAIGAPVLWSPTLTRTVLRDEGELLANSGAGRFVGIGIVDDGSEHGIGVAQVWDGFHGFRFLKDLNGRLSRSVAYGANLLGTVVGESTGKNRSHIPTLWRCAWTQAVSL
jgi:probable HAF family extracellular repeat protein